MKLRFTRRAARDIAEIAERIRAENLAAALRVRAAILDALQWIAEFPKLGRRQSVRGVRKFVAKKYPYIIYYSVGEEANEAVVLTVQHPARSRAYSDR